MPLHVHLEHQQLPLVQPAPPQFPIEGDGGDGALVAPVAAGLVVLLERRRVVARERLVRNLHLAPLVARRRVLEHNPLAGAGGALRDGLVAVGLRDERRIAGSERFGHVRHEA